MRSVLEPAPQLLARGLGILLESPVELQHLGFDLVDARATDRRAGLVLELFDRFALLLRERLVIAKRADDVLRPLAAREEVSEPGHLLHGALEPLLALAQLGVDVFRIVAQLLRDTLAAWCARPASVRW